MSFDMTGGEPRSRWRLKRLTAIRVYICVFGAGMMVLTVAAIFPPRPAPRCTDPLIPKLVASMYRDKWEMAGEGLLLGPAVDITVAGPYTEIRYDRGELTAPSGAYSNGLTPLRFDTLSLSSSCQNVVRDEGEKLLQRLRGDHLTRKWLQQREDEERLEKAFDSRRP